MISVSIPGTEKRRSEKRLASFLIDDFGRGADCVYTLIKASCSIWTNEHILANGRTILALALRTPYDFIGMGYWKVAGWLSRKTLRLAGNRAVFLTTRERASAGELAALASGAPRLSL